jgi:hypothetical protein
MFTVFLEGSKYSKQLVTLNTSMWTFIYQTQQQSGNAEIGGSKRMLGKIA